MLFFVESVQFFVERVLLFVESVLLFVVCVCDITYMYIALKMLQLMKNTKVQTLGTN